MTPYQSLSSTYSRVQSVDQSESISNHGFRNSWQIISSLVCLPDYIVLVYNITFRVHSSRVRTATLTQIAATQIQLGVAMLPSRKGSRVGEHLNRPVDGRSLHDVAGF